MTDTQSIEAEIARLGPWLHDIEVAPGVRTGAPRATDDPDKVVGACFDPRAMMGRLIGDIYGDGMGGRSLLDCACNAGGLSYAAAERGAGRTLAFDARQHWIDQAQFLKRFFPTPGLELRTLTLSDLPGLGLEPFDVSLFSGIFYHLPDPVAGLKLAADLTRELIVVNTSVLPRPEKALMLSHESATVALSGIDGLAWLPSGPEVLADILAWCGFPHSRVDRYWATPYPRGWRRLQIVAARDASTLERYDRVRPDAHPDRKPPFATRAMRRIRRSLARL